MSRGYLIYAYDNDLIRYSELAMCCAMLIQHNSVVKHVTMVTDQKSLENLRAKHGDVSIFDQIIISESTSDQIRRFRDSNHASHKLTWDNRSRVQAYEISPYEETILLDSDYLVMDKSLDAVWGTTSVMMANKSAISLLHTRLDDSEVRLEPAGIPLFWATVVYFRKDPEVETFFNMMAVVKDNYAFYQHLYRFPGSLYRNDYAFSVAAHLLPTTVDDLPNKSIMTALEDDDLIEADHEGLTFLSHGLLSRVTGVSVHVMNKFSLMRHIEDIIEELR